MSSKHLGERFDIHTGGVDHLAVHHPNEIAQSEAAFDVHPWVGTWMHGGWLMLDGDKIAKSTHGAGAPNLDGVIADGIDPGAFRLFLLGGHYRQQMSLSWDSLRASDDTLRRKSRRLIDGDGGRAGDAGALRERFHDAIADDLNTPRALAVLHEALALATEERRALAREFDAVLGLGLLQDADAFAPHIHERVAEREAARAARDFERADAIRAELAREGVDVEDTPHGPRLHRR